MKKDKEKKKKRVKRAISSPASTEVSPLEEEKIQETSSEAPLAYFLRVAGGKWKIRILWSLRDGQTRRYGEIKSAVSGITDMMLSQSLKELCLDGLLSRQQYQEIPPKVEYCLTSSGKTLLPALTALCEWERQMTQAASNK